MEFVGRTVRKEFQGFGVFSGVVKSYDSASGFFEIGYDDGDSEEVDFSELTALLEFHEHEDGDGVPTDRSPPRVGTRPKKRRMLLSSSNSGNENEFSSSVGNVVVASHDDSNLDIVQGGLRNENIVVDNFTKKLDSISNNLNSNDGALGLNLGVHDLDNNGKVNDEGVDLNLELIEENDLESKGKDLVDYAVKEDQCFHLNTELNGDEKKNQDVDLGGYLKGENSREDTRLNASDLEASGDIATRSPVVLGIRCCSDNQTNNIDHHENLVKTHTGGKRGRKRRNLADSPKTAAESVLRRSARRRAKFSADDHDGNAIKVDDNYDDGECALPSGSSPVISAVSEEQPTSSECKESEEPSIVPPKLELPPSTGNLNLDDLPVLDLFSVYAFLRSFSTILFLSPFELGDFVASLRSNSPSLLIDSIHVSLLRTLRKLLEFQSSESSTSATNCLRDLNWDLLDLITWPIFMAGYLLMKPGFDLAELKLFKTDYHKQPGSVKVKMLQYICDDVIELEAISSELNRRILVGDPTNLTDPDLNTKLMVSKKRKATMAISGSSCMSEEVIDETVDWNSDECCLCKMDGNLICCDGCPAAYHSKCVGIATSVLPEGDWYCPECVVDKKNLDINVAKAIRGAELLGVDIHGRLYYSTCGYLLVSDLCDAETSYHYYHMNDLTVLIEMLNLPNGPYRDISDAITKHWHLYNKVYGEKSKLDSEKPGEVERPLTGSSDRTATRKGMSQQLENGYLNFYSFARVASSVAGEWARRVPDNKTSFQTPTKSLEELISIQMKAITKISVDFCWSNIQNLSLDAQKEKCGWCLACKFPTDDGICLFYMNNASVLEKYTSQVLGFDSKLSRNDRLIDVMCHVLYIEDRLHGLLLGPWLNPHFPTLYRKRFHEASDITPVKDLLLMLESNIWSRVFSDEWIKHMDSVATVGSASHVTSKLRMPSTRNVVGKKRSKCSDPEPHSFKNASSGACLFWWRGGRLTRQLFNWKVLPCSLASKAARQGGGTKIEGILYPENSDFPRRSKALVWRASVQSAVTVEQLALQIRELDAHIKWEEIENSSHLAKMDKESIKSMRSFKKAIIRRKSLEGGVKYLLDFGKRRFIPDTVVKHGSKADDSSSSERKKYWVVEPYVPLFLLKPFEDKRIALKSNKTGSSSLPVSTRVVKNLSKKDVFSYLFNKAEKSENPLCGHCNKEVLIRDAISCQYCEGFFHKRHVRKGSGGMYTCNKCHVGDMVKAAGPKKGKLGSRMTKKVTKISKKGGKGKKLLQPQANNKGFVVPLRRSARAAKIVSLQSKKKPVKKKKKHSKSGGGKKKQLKSMIEMEKPKGKRGRPRKVTKLSFQKKRSPAVNSIYWLNGLLLSRKPDDERVTDFRSKNHIQRLDSIPDEPPKCSICQEPEFKSWLNYISCDSCRDWYHGDAFGLKDEQIGVIIGFKCHKCRERPPPVCLHLNSICDEPESGKQKNDEGTQATADVSSATVLLEQKPVDALGEQKDLLNEKAFPNAEPMSGFEEDPGQNTLVSDFEEDPAHNRPVSGPEEDLGQNGPMPGSEEDPGQNERMPGSEEDPGQNGPVPGSEEDPGQSRPVSGHEEDPVPGSENDLGQNAPVSGSDEGPGQSRPVSGFVEDPVPGSEEDFGQNTPVSGSNEVPGQSGPVSGFEDVPVPGSGQNGPVSGSDEDHGQNKEGPAQNGLDLVPAPLIEVPVTENGSLTANTSLVD